MNEKFKSIANIRFFSTITAMIQDDILKSDMFFAWHSESDEIYKTMHCHPEYEVYYLKSGDVEYRIEGRLYTPAPESLFLIESNSFHGVRVNSGLLYKRVSMHFPAELLDEPERNMLLAMFHGARPYYPDISATKISLMVQLIMDCKNMSEPLKTIAIKHRVAALLTHIYELYSRNMPCSPVSTSHNERILTILEYLNGNLRNHISLDDLSSRFYINKNYLNELFQMEMGTTINQYIRMKRVALAWQEMRKGYTAEEAAYRSGFNDYSNFYRAYKTFFGSMPSAQTCGDRVYEPFSKPG
ncbi:MAG: helix-turn-helix domain-containing protein [Treponema sp.]|jgi:AraC-like DNA-binding protein|nr:helix-turn-helix domain-containing protein [Treponema sp.]